jgi:DNA-binding LacI/PurR family transcriptional regulator
MLKELLRSHRPPMGVFCVNDVVALGALTAAQELELRVPEDLGIVGYDDIEMASVASVPLTTVATDHYGLGQSATQLLFGILSGDKGPYGHHLRKEAKLVVRKSC